MKKRILVVLVGLAVFGLMQFSVINFSNSAEVVDDYFLTESEDSGLDDENIDYYDKNVGSKYDDFDDTESLFEDNTNAIDDNEDAYGDNADTFDDNDDETDFGADDDADDEPIDAEDPDDIQ